MPDTAKVCFRTKRKKRGSLAAYINVRVRDRRTPRQLHLGYVSVTEGLTDVVRARIEAKLRSEWPSVRGHANVVVDWDHAAAKFEQKHSLLSAHHDTSSDSTASPLDEADGVDWEALRHRLLASLHRQNGKLTDVEDAVDEAILTVLQRLREGHGITSIVAYTHTVARRNLNQMLRQSSRFPELLTELQPAPDAEYSSFGADDLERLLLSWADQLAEDSKHESDTHLGLYDSKLVRLWVKAPDKSLRRHGRVLKRYFSMHHQHLSSLWRRDETFACHRMAQVMPRLRSVAASFFS